MVRREKALLFTAVTITAIVLGVMSTPALAGWPGQRPPAATPWDASPMGSGMGPMGWGTRGLSGDSEFDYLTEMVAHHQDAVNAARRLERSDRAEMRALGASIVTTQTVEITQMNAWLAQWYPGRSTAVPYQPRMRDLSRLPGDTLDEAFLRDMIPHHMAAVMMSQQLLVQGRIQHPELTEFAARVRDTQHAEIFQMQRYLADWFGGTWRMPYGPGGGGRGPAGMMGW